MTTADRMGRVLTVLAELLAEGEPIRARVEYGDRAAELRIGPAREVPPVAALPAFQAAPGGLPADGLWLSPEEEKILSVAPREHWATARELAKATDLPNDRDFAAVLRNLVRRNLLDSAVGRGYRQRRTQSVEREDESPAEERR